MKVLGWPWHFALPMFILGGLVFALDVAVWKVTPLPPPSDRVRNRTEASVREGQNQPQTSTQASGVASHAEPSNGGQQGSPIASSNQQQPPDQQIAVRSLPVLSVERDVLDYAGVILTLLIIAIAVYQIHLLNRTLKATENAADAAKRSAEAAILAVENNDRPWIRVYLPPETLTTSDTEGLVIKSGVTLRNVGKSVAEQVIIWNHLAVDLRTVRAEQENLRAYFDKPELIKSIGGMTIFPAEEKSQIHIVGTGKQPPEKYWREMMPDMLDRDLGDRILPLTYIGCVGYRYGTSDKWHFTYWGYDLVSSDGRHLPLHIATGKLPQPPFLREAFMGNLNRAD